MFDVDFFELVDCRVGEEDVFSEIYLFGGRARVPKYSSNHLYIVFL